MLRPKPVQQRIAAALALSAFVAVLGLALRQTGWRLGDAFLHESYDSLHALTGPRSQIIANSPIVVVYLDLHSFLAEKRDPAHPWPRDLHAKLVRRLAADGAQAVVFDIVFAAAGLDAAADTALADAIRGSGRVVLAGQSNHDASHMTSQDKPWARILQVEPPFVRFATNAVAWGVANHILDDDFVVRRHFAGFTSQVQPSLTWAAAEWLQLPVTRGSNVVRAANQRWIRYYGPALAFPNVSYTQAIHPGGVPDNFFRDKIVFIGARHMAELFHERQDEFRSPFHSWNNKELFMPGVEVHATELLNLLRGDGLLRLSTFAESLMLLAVALLFGGGLTWLRPMPATLTALVGAGFALGASRAAFGNGVWFPWLIVAAAQIPVALFGSWLFQFRDWYVTRRRLESAKRIADAKIREQAALIDKANDAILVHDLAGLVIYANPSAERLYGWSVRELQNGNAKGIEADPATINEARAVVVELGEWNGELQQRNRKGQKLAVESHWTLIRDEHGSPKSLLVINSDVTEKKQLEAESLRLQRTEAIGALASGMAHDLNNALAPVLMGAQLLLREAPNEEVRRVLRLMETSTQRGADLVRQVVLFARGRRGEMEHLDLRALVKEMETLVRDTFSSAISVTAHFAADLWPVRGNPTELHQVLLNLCVNARDAMPDGGTLTLALDNVELSEAEAREIAGAKPGQYVSLLVSDSGTGIPPELLPRIFEPFFTTKAEGKGTGLGLSTTARIVKTHGGFITVNSTAGEGVAFEILLPRLFGAECVEPKAFPEDPPRGQGELILVADDDHVVRELIKLSLEDHGYHVLLASNGADALAAFKAYLTDISLVLCDLSMPVLDGVRTAAAIRELRPNIPWIFMTGEDERSAATSLSKPFQLPVLLRHIHEMLRGGPGTTPP